MNILERAGAIVLALLVPIAAQRQDDVAPIGRLIDIGGRRLHQVCSGTGSPVVVIENGAGSFSVEWVRAQAEVAKFTEVCSYDRAGYAWSDRGPAQDTIEKTMDDLQLLLRKTVRPSHVLVGASLGAIYTRVSAPVSGTSRRPGVCRRNARRSHHVHEPRHAFTHQRAVGGRTPGRLRAV